MCQKAPGAFLVGNGVYGFFWFLREAFSVFVREGADFHQFRIFLHFFESLGFRLHGLGVAFLIDILAAGEIDAARRVGRFGRDHAVIVAIEPHAEAGRLELFFLPVMTHGHEVLVRINVESLAEVEVGSPADECDHRVAIGPHRQVTLVVEESIDSQEVRHFAVRYVRANDHSRVRLNSDDGRSHK